LEAATMKTSEKRNRCRVSAAVTRQKPILHSVRGQAASTELLEIAEHEQEFDRSLLDLVKNRLDDTVHFGKTYSVSELAIYLRGMFGHTLFFDSLLSIVQQYAIADVDVVSERTKPGAVGLRTGFNLSLFGHPGTGKTFATLDMIIGKQEKGVQPHGLPGKNRYCGGMTPAAFIEIGQAYEGRRFNFIVTEFNDWFKYKGMVEPLKLAMDRGTIKRETTRGVIGPYKFSSFFSANYNVDVKMSGYRATVSDVNFNAIEDRMLCRLHRLTKDRYQDIAESQSKLALGEIVMDRAQAIRDHVTLLHAIETRHPAVEGMFPYKPILLTTEAFDTMKKAREAIMEHLKYKESLEFSPRLEMRAVQLACAMSLLSYFQMDKEYITIDRNALNLATRFYVEEASIRSKEEFRPEVLLWDLGIPKLEIFPSKGSSSS